MITVERGPVGSEQLVVLWTWLLEGYVPVPHTVADLDELEALASGHPASTSGETALRASPQFVGKNAA